MPKLSKKRVGIELSVILPCRNEEKSLGFCLKEIKETLKKNKIKAEIIVSDSSSDNSPNITQKHKVILLKHNQEGYGIAYLKAFKIAKGKYIFMADPDCTYDFKEMPHFLNYLKQNYDFVIGNRFSGKIEKGAMPRLHQYIGSPLLSFFLWLFFRIRINDPYCGMRAIKKSALEKLNLQTKGMEFASEMLIKAIKNNLKIKETPINYYKRKGKSKLRSFSDGWKYMRFMLLYSPLFLFFIPGFLMLLAGALSMLWFYFGNPEVFGIKLFYHPMFFSSVLMISGYQLIIFSVFAKTYSITHLKEESLFMNKIYKYLTIEKATVLGIVIILSGLFIYFFILAKWIKSGLGDLNEIKNSIIALTLITIGIQTIFSSFIISILTLFNPRD